MPKGLFAVTPPRNIKAYLFLAFSAVLLAVFIFTNILIGRLATQTERTSRVFARFCATASFPAAQDTVFQAIIAEVIDGMNFPLVLTDVKGVPRAWKNVGVDPATVPDRSLDSLAAELTPAPAILERIERVRLAADRLDEDHDPIPLVEPAEGRTIGLVHWGEPQALGLLRYVPYASVGVIVILLGLTFWGARGIRLAESRSIWVGLAKETAHQLGTPLSSVLGWVELLRERARSVGGSDQVVLERAFLEQTVTEMEHDVERLNKVAARFSQIGSVPALVRQDLEPIVEEAVGYLERRLPNLGRPVEIVRRYEPAPPVAVNRELLEWVVENLLVNALNALEGNRGTIEVTLAPGESAREVELTVRDTGRGMSPEEQRRAFDPGFTTRKRGWGLGLAIAKRIVEEYHGGQIAIRRSAPGEGTTFRLGFPA